MKRFGNTMVAVGPEGDEAAEGVRRAGRAAGDPLVIEAEGDNWAITAAALTSKLWLVKQDANKVPMAGQGGRPPSAIRRRSRCRSTSRITADGKGLWVNTFMDGTTRYFDLSNPEAPKQTYSKVRPASR